MQEIIRQYGGTILAAVAAGVLLGVFAMVLSGPLGELILSYANGFLTA